MRHPELMVSNDMIMCLRNARSERILVALMSNAADG